MKRKYKSISISGATAQCRPGPPHSWGFYITHTMTQHGRVPLDGWSARRRDNTDHSQETRHPRPYRNFCFYSLTPCTSSVLVSLSWLSCILSLLRTHNTNTHTSGRIRTRSPIKHSTTNSRFKPLDQASCYITTLFSLMMQLQAQTRGHKQVCANAVTFTIMTTMLTLLVSFLLSARPTTDLYSCKPLAKPVSFEKRGDWGSQNF